MADAVTVRKNGFAEMAFTGDRSDIWHRLGNQLEVGASIEEWQVAAGMDWRIQRAVARYNTSRDGLELREMPENHILFRSDSKDALSIVSSRYKVVQPKEVLEFFRDLVGPNGYELSTAGTLFGGRKFWALASVGESAVVVGDDEVKGYLLLSTSCDGSLPTEARFTTVRVVCNNTLQMAVSEKSKKRVSIRHISAFKPDAVKDQLGLARGYFREFLVAARKLAKTPIHTVAATEFVSELLATDDSPEAVIKAQGSKNTRNIVELFNGRGRGAQLPGAMGTLWGLVNAVTEHVDHHARSKSDSHRLDSAWFGVGDDLKSRALEKALERV